MVGLRSSSGPPSRESDIWILVSFVFRLMEAVRLGNSVEVIVGGIGVRDDDICDKI